MSEGPPTFAVLGLGEAGSAIATDLAAGGARVLGWDPARHDELAGVELAAGDREAARGADLVLSANSASVAVAAAESVAPVLRGGQVYADLNTGSPGLKRAVADAVAASGAAFADVALMAPVPGRGARTPALVSGSGGARFAAAMAAFGMPVTVLGAEPGAAAARKLARSVFTKGLAAAVGEALAAGERLGCAEWLGEDIARTLEEADEATLERLVEGSRRHAGRRIEEMAAAVAMLEELGVEPRVAAASQAWLRSLTGSEVAGPAGSR
jgi:3-hydroxyisobutyrate dehydrogenase-like beta-hydroxyacid dehydrogenase